MRLFGISLHVSGMLDIRHILASIDGSHTIDDLTLSNHAWVAGRQKDSVPLLDGGRWREVVERAEWTSFHDRWKTRLDGYDGFIAFYPPLFACLYREFPQPVICQIPIRYEYPFHSDAARWNRLNADLRSGVDAGKIVLCANNPYDAAYAELFLERPVRYVPSLCEYTGASWSPERPEVVYYCRRRVAELSDPLFAWKSDVLPAGHAWSDVARFRAIAHVPYNASTMSIMEQYAMGIPLLFPTLDFALDLYERGAPILEELSWASTERLPPGSAIEPRGGFPEGHDPNDYSSIESVRQWLRLADFYDPRSMPGIVYFSSMEELEDIVHRDPAFFEEVNRRMRAGYAIRRHTAIEGWMALLGEVAAAGPE